MNKNNTTTRASGKITLSDFFPPNTAYFYGFPFGEESGFFSAGNFWEDDVISGRPMTFAGKNLSIVTFAPQTTSESKSLQKKAGIRHSNVLTLNARISGKISDEQRNMNVKKALKKMFTGKQLIMAQPYMDPLMKKTYLIEPGITTGLNNKLNRKDYIPEKYIPKISDVYENGKLFAASIYDGKYPCVVKVASSSCGDGVRVCRNIIDMIWAKRSFSDLKGSIFIEQFIAEKINIGIQFGIPFDSRKRIKIIGFSQQLTGNGHYLGGIVNPGKKIKILSEIYKVLKKEILPKVRQMGWFGIGGIDVLIDKKNRFYFIDPNFRITAASAFIFMAKNKRFNKPVLSFMGTINGNPDEVLALTRKGKNQMLKIVSLIRNGNVIRLNAALIYKNRRDLVQKAKQLLGLGLQSATLEKIVTEFDKTPKFTGIFVDNRHFINKMTANE